MSSPEAKNTGYVGWIGFVCLVLLAICAGLGREIAKLTNHPAFWDIVMGVTITMLWPALFGLWLIYRSSKDKVKLRTLRISAWIFTALLLLAARNVPSILPARKRSQATRILEDLRMINAAVNQYALEFGKKTSEAFNWHDVQRYLKPGTTLYTSGCTDMLGGSFVITSVGVPPKLSDPSFNAMSDIAPESFWSPYR